MPRVILDADCGTASGDERDSCHMRSFSGEGVMPMTSGLIFPSIFNEVVRSLCQSRCASPWPIWSDLSNTRTLHSIPWSSIRRLP